MTRQIHSYGKVYNLGHAAIVDLLDGPVVVEEKVDGSQFSFALLDGELQCRSRNKQLVLDEPDNMFAEAVASAREIHDEVGLTEGWIYRGEYLRKPKHNTLAYDRVPDGHIALWDVETGPGTHLSPLRKVEEASRVGLDVVPVLFEGELRDMAALDGLLERESMLGGQLIEGVVIKNYARFGKDGKLLTGKHVSERFKEVHRNDWKERHPKRGDVLDVLIAKYKTEPRWDKAVQHLRERGELTGSPRDIGALIKEARADIVAECEAELKDALWEWAKPKLMRGVTGGLPEWYKRQLAANQFDKEGAA